MEMTDSAECPEGLESSMYYDFYRNVAQGDSHGSSNSDSDQTPVDRNFEIEMLNEGSTCTAEFVRLGFTESAYSCAQEVLNDNSMLTIFFDYDPNDGECRAVFTESRDCPEGFE
jgi:hypothetical protein